MEPLRQSPEQLVDVTDWAGDEVVYPEGSRPKSTFISPSDPGFDFLRPAHRYLLKQSAQRYPAQFWAEIIAYRIGTFLGISVPPAFAALDRRANIYGSLIEWFYVDHIQNDGFDRYVSGGQYMRRRIPGYDMVKGKQHNFQTVFSACQRYHLAGYLTDPPLRHWAKVLLFDALIGNQDRHQDNWGLLWRYRLIGDRNIGEREKARFAPAFDNGTSLGHEITEKNLTVTTQAERIERYVQRGHHHMRWSLEDVKPAGHFDLIGLIAEKWPDTRQFMASLLAYSPADLEAQLSDLVAFPVPPPYSLSAERLHWVYALLRVRREHLLMVLS